MEASRGIISSTRKYKYFVFLYVYMSNYPSIILTDSSGNLISNSIIVYNAEDFTKTYYSIVQGAAGKQAVLDISILSEVIQNIINNNPNLTGPQGLQGPQGNPGTPGQTPTLD